MTMEAAGCGGCGDQTGFCDDEAIPPWAQGLCRGGLADACSGVSTSDGVALRAGEDYHHSERPPFSPDAVCGGRGYVHLVCRGRSVPSGRRRPWRTWSPSMSCRRAASPEESWRAPDAGGRRRGAQRGRHADAGRTARPLRLAGLRAPAIAGQAGAEWEKVSRRKRPDCPRTAAVSGSRPGGGRPAALRRRFSSDRRNFARGNFPRLYSAGNCDTIRLEC